MANKKTKPTSKPKLPTGDLTAEQQEKYDAFVAALHDPEVSETEVAKKQKAATFRIQDIPGYPTEKAAARKATKAGFDDFLHTYAFQQVQTPKLVQKKPGSLQAAAQVLIDANAAGQKVRAAGSGHSYSDVSMGKNIFINTHSMKKMGWPLRTGTGQAVFQGQLRQDDLKVAWQWNTMLGKWKKMSDVKISGGVITNDSSLSDILKVRSVAEGNTQLIETEAGIKLEDLNEQLKARDLGLPNMGGFDGQTLVGVISTSTHGAGIDLGPFPDLVKSLVLVTTGKLTSGNIVSGESYDDFNYYRIEPSNGITNAVSYKQNQALYQVDNRDIKLVQDDNIFNAVKCNFGTMGVIASVVIKVMQKYYMTETCNVTTLDKLLPDLKPNPKNRGSLPDKLLKYRNYSWMVCPYAVTLDVDGHFNPLMKPIDLPSGGLTTAQHKNIRVVEIMRNITPKPKGLKESERSHKGDKAQLKAFRAIVDTIRIAPGLAPRTTMVALLTMQRKDKVDIYHQIYLASTPAGAGWATEMGFPVQTQGSKPTWTDQPLRKAIKQVTDKAHEDFSGRKKRVLTGPYAVRFVQQSPAYMSMMNNTNTVMIELDMLSGSPYGVEVVNGQQDQLIKLPNARPHWGLEFSHWKSTPPELAAMYPDFPKWLAVYQQLNSAGTFENGTTARLGISLIAKKPVSKAATDAKKAKMTAKPKPKAETATAKRTKIAKPKAAPASAAKATSTVAKAVAAAKKAKIAAKPDATAKKTSKIGKIKAAAASASKAKPAGKRKPRKG